MKIYRVVEKKNEPLMFGKVSYTLVAESVNENYARGLAAGYNQLFPNDEGVLVAFNNNFIPPDEWSDDTFALPEKS